MDGEFGAFVRGEHFLVEPFDGRAALVLPAVLIEVVAVRGPEAGHGLGVALVERRDKLLARLPSPGAGFLLAPG